MMLAAVEVARADPPQTSPPVGAQSITAPQLDCHLDNPQHAKSQGDQLYARGAFARAGACYEMAGEYDLANRAFLKATGPESAATARQLTENRAVVQAQVQNWKKVIRRIHSS